MPTGIHMNYVKLNFSFGYWPDLSTLEERLKDRLHDFLKCIFTDEIEHRDIDKTMTETKTFVFFVSGYQIDDEDLDIFSCLIFEYLGKDNNDAPAGIVYMATGPMFCGLNLGSLMLCILSYFLHFQEHSTTLFISTAPNNDEWYSTQGFVSVDSDN